MQRRKYWLSIAVDSMWGGSASSDAAEEWGLAVRVWGALCRRHWVHGMQNGLVVCATGARMLRWSRATNLRCDWWCSLAMAALASQWLVCGCRWRTAAPIRVINVVFHVLVELL